MKTVVECFENIGDRQQILTSPCVLYRVIIYNFLPESRCDWRSRHGTAGNAGWENRRKSGTSSGGFFTIGQTIVETRTCRRHGNLLFARCTKTEHRRGGPLDDRFPRRRTRSAAEWRCWSGSAVGRRRGAPECTHSRGVIMWPHAAFRALPRHPPPTIYKQHKNNIIKCIHIL